MSSYRNEVDNNELYHYGVMGMKWGVRRYQDKDGNLTDKGKRRFEDVSIDERLKRRQSKQAIKLLQKNRSREGLLYNASIADANIAYKKADKYTWKSEAAKAKGNQRGFEKYQSKAWKQLGIQATYLEKAGNYLKNYKAYDQKISDI